ncbi:MAG: nucleotidyl transferase AbiEii/AbiGii toxin family protein, partial [Clostridium sp.]
VDWEKDRSRRDYNCYTFSYQPLEDIVPDSLIQGVKMEVVLGSTSFPTVQMPVDSYVYQYLSKENMDIVEEYDLKPFEMKLQSLERTLADKVFALCDYYVQGKSKRYSRHLYDIYKLTNKIDVANALSNLYNEIKVHRKQMKNCQSAQDGEDVSGLINAFCDEDFYKNDYQEITNYFSDDYVAYEDTIKQMRKLAKMIKEVT